MLGLILLLVFKVCSSNAVEAISGSTTILTCPLQGSSLQWQRLVVNSAWSTLQERAKYGNVNTASLIIYNVDPGDDGSYLCSNGSQQSYIQVTVIVIATEGSTTTLTCPLQGLSFQWLKWTISGLSIIQQGAKYGNVNTGYLAIHNVDPHDGGTYLCKNSTEQLQMNIVFRATPIWGSNAVLTCTFQGSQYYWQKRTDSGWMSLTQAGNKYGNVNSGYMTIYNVQLNDGGRYRCWVNHNLEEVDVIVRVNGDWGSWGSWTQCTNTCVEGTRTRYRACDNPSPANGVSTCLELYNETGSCSTNISCPVNGNWGTWQDWNSCSVTCGGGSRSRYRECNYPEPAHGGLNCQGNDTEIDSCSIKLCPLNGNWGTWQDWNSCSATCGSGSRSRYHECNNPEPAHAGSNCQGNDTEIESCYIKLCPVGSEADNSSATIGIGAGIGSTAVVVGLLIVFIYIMKIYRLRKPAESAIYDTIGETGSSNSDLHIYDGLQQNTESPTHRQKDVTYVNTII